MRRAAALVAVAVLALPACGDKGPINPNESPSAPLSLYSPPPTTAAPSNLPKCQFPKEIAMPDWLPPDLPFPEETYANQDFYTGGDVKRVLLVIRTNLVELARFILKEWPAAGWQLGRGESEFGEIEDQFAKGSLAGAFRAQEVYCDPGYVQMLLVIVPRGSPAPTRA